MREKAGIKVLNVCSLAADPKQAMVIEESESMQKITDFLEVVKSKQNAGDISKMEVKLYNEG